MSVWTVFVWATSAFFLVDVGFVLAAQFLWSFWYLTKYDTPPPIVGWILGSDFSVTPGLNEVNTNSDDFTPEQWNRIWNMFLLLYIIGQLLQFVVIPPILTAETSGISEAAAATTLKSTNAVDTAQLQGLLNNMLKSESPLGV